ncbi:peptidylprolyl isomerase [Candidatus Woesearchaeota archaeon]|nr:peptidylprolyl isomerase [Candidatus Woesearchaeota archaeon]
MAEKIQKHDFVELDYTGKLTDGTVFDTTQKSVSESSGLHAHDKVFAPAVVCIGERQLLPGLDDALVDKEMGKEYSVTLPPEKTFGKKDIKKMKIVPMNAFKEHKVQPHPGLQIDMDGERGVITQISGGRVIVNFNNPLAGREIVYDFKVNKKITDQKEQAIIYLHNSFGIPKDKVNVEIKEQKATVELPFEFPAQILELLSKKMIDLVKLKEVKFTKKEVKK